MLIWWQILRKGNVLKFKLCDNACLLNVKIIMAVFKHVKLFCNLSCSSECLAGRFQAFFTGIRRFNVSKTTWNNSVGKAKEVFSRLGHKPVLVGEVLDVIEPTTNQVLLDMTFGAGGHTKSFLEKCPQLKVFALDRDPLAYRYAQELSLTCSQVVPLHGKFSQARQLLSQHGVDKVNAVLFDLGSSSMQFDDPDRGFSISRDGPLDMRMDGNKGQTSAEDVVNYLSEEGLYQIIKKYGEDKKARLIARAVVDARNTFGRITTTRELADIVASVYQGCEHKQDKLGRPCHVATKTFQALRIFVNDELNELYNGLQLAHFFLSPGGVCAAISFHSLEDRIIKREFHGIDMDAKFNLSVTERYRDPSVTHEREVVEGMLENRWEPLSRKAVTPTEMEMECNPRSRSAKLRAARKTV